MSDKDKEWKAVLSDIKKQAMSEKPASDYLSFVHLIRSMYHRLSWEFQSETLRANGFTLKGFSKILNDEIYPIGYFAELYLSKFPSARIKWVDGNQTYDATVTEDDSTGGVSGFDYLEVTTLQGEIDAKINESLSSNQAVIFKSCPLDDFRYKLDKLREVLEKKSQIDYPNNTALLIYTVEDRYHTGIPVGESVMQEKREGFKSVLLQFEPKLQGFKDVFIYCNKQVYCSLRGE